MAQPRKPVYRSFEMLILLGRQPPLLLATAAILVQDRRWWAGALKLSLLPQHFAFCQRHFELWSVAYS